MSPTLKKDEVLQVGRKTFQMGPWSTLRKWRVLEIAIMRTNMRLFLFFNFFRR